MIQPMRPRGSARPSGRRRSIAAPIGRFTAAGLVVMLALAAIIGVQARRAGGDEAIRSAEQVARVVAHGVVAQLLDADLVRGSPAAHADLRSAVDSVLATGPVVRVKVWDATGQVIWSDEHRLIGEVFPLGDGARAALDTGAVVSAITDLSEAENRYERGRGDLLEAYVGVTDPDGRPLVVEVYQRYDAVADAARETWLSFAPASLGALLLLQLVQVPFAWRLARQSRAYQEKEAALLQAAVEASEGERRRIARDVHDGIVQDLTGLTYDLDAARLGGPGSEDRGALIARTAGGLRRCVTELRRLLVALSPPRLPEGGLRSALIGLAEGLTREGRQVTVRAEGIETLPPPAAALLYRSALEGLRNVSAHSGATHVDVSVTADRRSAVLVVHDDGRGYDELRLAARGAAGHVGLAVLRDLLTEAGGTLVASSTPGHGTRLEARVPLDAAAAPVGTPP